MSSCTIVPGRNDFHAGVPVLSCGAHSSRILPAITSSAANPWLQGNPKSPGWMLNTCLHVTCERAHFCQHHHGERKVVRAVIKNLFGVAALGGNLNNGNLTGMCDGNKRHWERKEKMKQNLHNYINYITMKDWRTESVSMLTLPSYLPVCCLFGTWPLGKLPQAHTVILPRAKRAFHKERTGKMECPPLSPPASPQQDLVSRFSALILSVNLGACLACYEPSDSPA